MEQSKTKENILFLLIIAVALAGVILRFNGMDTRSLEYDEVWTLQNYSTIPVSQVFSDLATPNNHPLNTLFIQWSIDKSNFEFRQLRMPVFLFGLATIALTILFSWKAIKRKDAVCFATACIAFNGYLIHYSQTARGYSIQSFFVLLTAAALYWLAQNKKSILFGAIFLFAAVCSCLTITSGLIFVCALCGAYIAVHIRKEKIKVLLKENAVFIIAAVLFCVFAGTWYGMNYSKIAAGQTFGTSVLHPWDFLKFVFKISTQLVLFPFVFIHIAVLFFKGHPRKNISVFALIFFALCFLSALATKAGFDRVYLPMYAIEAITAAMVIPDMFSAFKKEKFITPVFAVLALLLALPMNIARASQAKPDYIPLMEEISSEIQSNVFVNFAVHDTYPLQFNAPESKQDYLKRLTTMQLNGFVQVNSPGEISLYDPKRQSPVTVKTPAGPVQSLKSKTGTDIELYAIQPLTLKDDPRGKVLLLTMSPHPQEMFIYFFSRMTAAENWYLTNLFLTFSLSSPEGKPLKCGAYICPAATHDAAYYLTITKLTGINWRFYIVK